MRIVAEYDCAHAYEDGSEPCPKAVAIIEADHPGCEYVYMGGAVHREQVRAAAARLTVWRFLASFASCPVVSRSEAA
jgi:hypothetical protein